MTHIPNNEGIKSIIMKPTVSTLCAIGQDWFQSQLTITFIPNDCYPDYIEVQKWIMDNIDGKEMNIEHVVKAIYDFLANEYKPKALIIENYVEKCKSHFDVIVNK